MVDFTGRSTREEIVLALQEKYKRINSKLIFIGRRLKNPDVPEEKKKRLQWEATHLKNNVIPQLVEAIGNHPPLNPSWEI